MLSKFEIAIIVLLVVNVLATIYFNYSSQSEENYARYPSEMYALHPTACNGKSDLGVCVKTTLQDMYNRNPNKKRDWQNANGPSNINGTIAGQDVLNRPLVFGRDRNDWGVQVKKNCSGDCGRGGSYSKCYNCLNRKV